MNWPWPHDLIIETSTHCNLRCNFCFRQVQDLSHEPWTMKEFKDTIDKLPFVDIVRLGVQGEPLLYEQNFEFMKYLLEQGKMFSITTNALFLDERNIRRLPQNCAMVFASVDAGSQEVYDVYRDKADFEIWKSNVARLRTLRPDIPVQVNYLLFRRNLYDVPKMIDFCAQYQCALSSTFPVIFTEQFAKDHDAYWLNHLPDIIAANMRYAQARNVHYLCSSGKLEWRQCTLPWQQPLISISGDVYSDFFIYQPRNYDKTKPETMRWTEWYKNESKQVPQDHYCFGNIFQDDWATIWRRYQPFLTQLAYINSLPHTREDFHPLRDTIDPLNERWTYCLVCGRRWGFSY